MHRLCKELDLDALKSPTPTKPIFYDGIWRYSRSKLGDILFTRELSRRLLAEAGSDPSSRRIYVNTFFPGNIATEQMDVWNDYFGAVFGRLFKLFFSLFGQSPTDGAATAVYLATSPEVTKGDGMRGEYFIPIATKDRTTAIAEDMTLARAAWVGPVTSWSGAVRDG
jgi:NAD(P)-dependent dehydrogenase (short-subunit alcohol dehydrogenase family)